MYLLDTDTVIYGLKGHTASNIFDVSKASN